MDDHKQTLIDITKSAPNSEGALDGIVHDLKAEEATGINNGGIEDQVDYIVDSLGIDVAIKRIREALLITEEPLDNECGAQHGY